MIAALIIGTIMFVFILINTSQSDTVKPVKNNELEREFNQIQIIFDTRIRNQNMQPSLDQLNQLRSAGLSPAQVTAQWREQIKRVPAHHQDEYIAYWNQLEKEVTFYYNRIKSLKLPNHPGANLTGTYDMVKAVNRGINW